MTSLAEPARFWERLRDVLAPDIVGLLPCGFRAFQRIIIALGLAVLVLGTVPSIADGWGAALTALVLVISLLFLVEYGARLLVAAHDGRAGTPWLSALRCSLTWLGLIDLAAAVPVPVALVLGVQPMTARLLGVLWVLKLTRTTPALGLLVRVVRSEAHALVGVMIVFLIVLVLAGTGAYVLERDAQPTVFSSIPGALWWAITTLTTTGYGDEVPVTVAGRLLAGVVMISGIGLFALWAGILAGGFSREVRRHDFVRTWELVARLPLFQTLGAAKIAEIVGLLRPVELPANRAVVRKGQTGDCMYFIARGEVAVDVEPVPVRLGEGAFFGEMALVTGGPRMATVTTTQPTMLLQLDVVEFRNLAASHPSLLAAIEARAAGLGEASQG